MKYNIKKVNLSNKSRKGTYYYYKEKGKAGRYYKIKPRHYTGSKETYKETIKQSYIKKQNIVSLSNALKQEQQKRKKAELTVKKQKILIEKLLKRLQQKQKIKVTKSKTNVDDLIQKGMYERTIDLKKLNQNSINLIKKEIVQKMTKNKQQALLLLKNFNKTKRRLQYEINMYDERGELIKTAYGMGKTMEQIKQDMNTLKLYDQEVGEEDEYRKGKLKNQVFEKKGYTSSINKLNATIKQIIVTIKYVRG